MMTKAKRNVGEVFSPKPHATKIGDSIVRLKIISRMPRTRAITAICIETVALEKREVYRKQFLDGFGIFFVDYEHNDMIVTLDNRVMVSNNNLAIAH